MNELSRLAEELPSSFPKSAAALRILRSISRFLQKRFEHTSQTALLHEAGETLISHVKDELEMLTAAKADCLRRLDGTPTERLAVEQDLEYIEQKEREMTVKLKSLHYLPQETSDGHPTDKDPVDEPCEPQHTEERMAFWMSSFDELARKANESWRRDLLSRALAIDSQFPGAITPRVLWTIGTLEEEKFHAFAAILDSMIAVDQGLVLPFADDSYDVLDRPGIHDAYDIEITLFGRRDKVTLSRLIPMVGDLNLLADQDVYREFNAGQHEVSCGLETSTLEFPSTFSVSGVLLTSLGEQLSYLYEHTPNEIAQKAFAAICQYADRANERAKEIAKRKAERDQKRSK